MDALLSCNFGVAHYRHPSGEEINSSTFVDSSVFAPAYAKSVSRRHVALTQHYPIPAPVPIPIEFRSIPHPGSESPQRLLSSSVTNPLPPAFQSITPFPDVPSVEQASICDTDTAETVERSFARVTASVCACGVNIAGNSAGLLNKAAEWMRDSARLHRALDQSDSLSSALEEILCSSKGAAPGSLVEEVTSCFGVDAGDSSPSSVVVEAGDSPEGLAFAVNRMMMTF